MTIYICLLCNETVSRKLGCLLILMRIPVNIIELYAGRNIRDADYHYTCVNVIGLLRHIVGNIYYCIYETKILEFNLQN